MLVVISVATASPNAEFRRGATLRTYRSHAEKVGLQMRLALIGIFLLGATMTNALGSNVFTPTSGSSCADVSKPEFNVWRCPVMGDTLRNFRMKGTWSELLSPKKHLSEVVQ